MSTVNHLPTPCMSMNDYFPEEFNYDQPIFPEHDDTYYGSTDLMDESLMMFPPLEESQGSLFAEVGDVDESGDRLVMFAGSADIGAPDMYTMAPPPTDQFISGSDLASAATVSTTSGFVSPPTEPALVFDADPLTDAVMSRSPHSWLYNDAERTLYADSVATASPCVVGVASRSTSLSWETKHPRSTRLTDSSRSE